MKIYKEKIEHCTTLDELEKVRLEYLGKNGIITQELKKFKELPVEEKKIKGQELNLIRKDFEEILSKKKQALSEEALKIQIQKESVDISLPARTYTEQGAIHPISQTFEIIEQYFESLGFEIKDGPEIEDNYHNFDALNIPAHHPARQNHDTFFFKNLPYLLRTHTSNIQIRTMKSTSPPLRIIAKGRVYRSDYDATHTPMFHQIEGLVIEEGIHMGHLKGCLEDFFKYFFEAKNLKIRFRPSFFPFTEPSAEVDINYTKRDNHIVLGEGDDWLEVLGCGMVHPKVLKNCGLDPQRHQGFAFGLGVDRFTMLKYKISDLRTLFNNDERFLKSF